MSSKNNLSSGFQIIRLLIYVGQNIFTKAPARAIPCLLLSCNTIGLSILVMILISKALPFRVLYTTAPHSIHEKFHRKYLQKRFHIF